MISEITKEAWHNLGLVISQNKLCLNCLCSKCCDVHFSFLYAVLSHARELWIPVCLLVKLSIRLHGNARVQVGAAPVKKFSNLNSIVKRDTSHYPVTRTVAAGMFLTWKYCIWSFCSILHYTSWAVLNNILHFILHLWQLFQLIDLRI